jgi:hypothetical protein
LLLGGILYVTTVIFSGLCITLDDLDGPGLKDIGPAFGMNTSGGLQTTIMVDLFDKCFTMPNGNTNFFDIVKIEKKNGTSPPYTVTMREDIINNTVNQVQNQMSSAVNADSTQTLATNPDFVTFQGVLTGNPVSTWIIPQSSMQYPALLQSGGNVLNKYLATSLACPDHTPTGVATTQQVQGLTTFGAALLALPGTTVGTLNPGYPCGNNVLCAASNAECQEGQAYMTIKQSLTSSTAKIYPCPMFAMPGTTTVPCDPATVAGGPSACIAVDGSVTLVTPTKMCNMQEFETYISDFAARLNKVFAHVDNQVATTSSGITDGMNNLVNNSVIQPLLLIVDGSTCNWIGQTYTGMITALCFQGTYGLVMIATAYVWLAFLVAILIFVMYVLYRRSMDNVDFQYFQSKGQS